MGNVKESMRKRINIAASNFLCEQESGDLYDAYLVLQEAQEAGKGTHPASKFATIWEPMENMSVDGILDVIDSAVSMTAEVPEFMQNIDWEALKKQKNLLLETINNDAVNPEHKEALESILVVLDAMQDYAVGQMGIEENKVFDLTQED